MLVTPGACTYVVITSPFDVGALAVKAFRWLRYKCAGRFRRQTCMDCYRDGRSSVWFHVPDHVWYAVMGNSQDVLCLTCFDRRAETTGVDYSGDVIVMGRSAWLADGTAARALEASNHLSPH